MPKPPILEHRRNIGSISRHNQHSPSLEKHHDQLELTRPYGFRTNPAVKSSQLTNDITIPSSNQLHGQTGTPARRPLQIPPSQHRTQTPSSMETKKDVPMVNYQPYPFTLMGRGIPIYDPSYWFRANIRPDSWSSRHCRNPTNHRTGLITTTRPPYSNLRTLH